MKMKHVFGSIIVLMLAFGLAIEQVQAQPAHAGPPPREDGPTGFGDFTPPGRDPDFVPPGRNPDFVPPAEEPGEDEEEGDGLPFCSRGNAGNGPNGQAGLSSIAHLNFSPGDTEDGEASESEAWARMMYRWYAPVFDYVFNGHQLPVDGEFTLTYQPQPLPSAGVICLGSGTVNEEGDIHIQDAFDIATDLPAAYDENEEEAILALVLSADVDCETGDMVAWQPEAYLFGDEGMFYVHSDLDDDDDDDDDDGED
jgi:hypothetical protein